MASCRFSNGDSGLLQSSLVFRGCATGVREPPFVWEKRLAGAYMVDW